MRAGRTIVLLAVLSFAPIAAAERSAATRPTMATASMPSTAPCVSSEQFVPRLQAALRELEAGHLERAEYLARPLCDAVYPARGAAWIVVAAARQAQGHYGSAARAYARFLLVCRNPALRAYVMSQIDQCALGRGRAGMPPSQQLTSEQLGAFTVVDEQPCEATSAHFTVECNNWELAQLVLTSAEAALKRISGVLLNGSEYPHRVQIIVYPSSAEYRAAATSEGDPTTQSGSFELRQDGAGQWHRVIRLIQLDDGGQFDPQLIDRVLPHELSHLVVTEWFGDIRCPLYLQEGLAMAAECGEQDARLLQAAMAAAGGRAISLEELLTREDYPARQMSLFYAEAYSLVSYLRRGLNDRQFAQMLVHVKEGCTLREALVRALAMVEQPQMMSRLEHAWLDDAISQAQYLMALEPPATCPSK